MKKLILSFIALVMLPVAIGLAQSSTSIPPSVGPFVGTNWYRGYVPTPDEWNKRWSNKIDYFPGGLPIIYGGCGATTAAQCALNLGTISNVVPRASKIANYSVLAAESSKGFDNIGASGSVNLSLPIATPGLIYTFTVAAAQTFIVTANTGATISLGEVTSASAGNVTANTVFSTVQLEAISATQWVAVSITGTWTVN